MERTKGDVLIVQEWSGMDTSAPILCVQTLEVLYVPNNC